MLGKTLYKTGLTPQKSSPEKSNPEVVPVNDDDEDDYGDILDDEGNQVNDEDDEDDDDEDDEGDEGNDRAGEDSNAITTQAARNHIFPMLVNELVKEGIVNSTDGKVLLQEFWNGNQTINGALDVYDLDSDMAELVDTLQRAAKAVAVPAK